MADWRSDYTQVQRSEPLGILEQLENSCKEFFTGTFIIQWQCHEKKKTQHEWWLIKEAYLELPAQLADNCIKPVPYSSAGTVNCL